MRRTGIILIICGLLLAAGAVAWSTTAVSKLEIPDQYRHHVALHRPLRHVSRREDRRHPRHTELGGAHHRPHDQGRAVRKHLERLSWTRRSTWYCATVLTEKNAYAFNRTSMTEVTSPDVYTFTQGNTPPVVGSSYITLPMNLKAGMPTINIWKPETGTTYPVSLVPAGAGPAALDGLGVDWFFGRIDMVPVAPYKRVALASRGLPMSISPASVQAEMTQAGISVPALSEP